MKPRLDLLPEMPTTVAIHLRFALEGAISLNSNGIGGEADFSSGGIGRAEEEEEEFPFLVCTCCFLPPQICARSKIEGEGDGEGERSKLEVEEDDDEEEEGEMINLHGYRPWSDLPADILDIFVSHLQFADYVRFGAVCKSWRSVTADTPHLRALQHPWLAILDKSTFFSPVEDRLYHQNIPFASSSHCIGRSQGCLVFMNESEGGHIFNPFTNQTIKFPSSRLEVWYGLEKTVLSSAPSRGGARDCVVAVFSDFKTLGFCRPGDRDLFLHDCGTQWMQDVVFFKGLLYCLTLDFHLMVFEFGPGPEMKYTESYIALDSVKPCDVGNDDVQYYLAEFAGELLMVSQYWVFDEEDGDACRTVGFGVYKLDFSVPEWVEVETFGNKMLLLDESCLRCVDAVDFSASGFKPNCIYFTDGELDKYEWRMFSLEDKKIQPFSPSSSCAMRSPLIMIKLSDA